MLIWRVGASSEAHNFAFCCSYWCLMHREKLKNVTTVVCQIVMYVNVYRDCVVAFFGVASCVVRVACLVHIE